MTHQPAPAGSERDAHGPFTFARNRASEQQTGYIHAGDQQHQGYRAQQQPQRGTHIADVRAKRVGDESAGGVGLWILLREAAANHGQLGLSLRERYAGMQASQHAEAGMPVAAL